MISEPLRTFVTSSTFWILRSMGNASDDSARSWMWYHPWNDPWATDSIITWSFRTLIQRIQPPSLGWLKPYGPRLSSVTSNLILINKSIRVGPIILPNLSQPAMALIGRTTTGTEGHMPLLPTPGSLDLFRRDPLIIHRTLMLNSTEQYWTEWILSTPDQDRYWVNPTTVSFLITSEMNPLPNHTVILWVLIPLTQPSKWLINDHQL